jgi:predicted nucleotidyltransferase component of viral defense system
MSNTIYQQQVGLLLDVLPFLKQLDCFALKGGTAINLFIRDMPRLSIDIDLTYLPIEPRRLFLSNMNNKLEELASVLEGKAFQVSKRYSQQEKCIIKLIVSNGNVDIKIEPNTVLRGTVFGVEERYLSPRVQDEFLQAQKVTLVSLADLYAGKICAALDRQHPRDLFDIKLLLENEGITEQIRQAFVIYLASGTRPMSELLSPHQLELKEVYQKEFLGMTNLVVTYDELLHARKQLIDTIRADLTNNEKLFLISIKEGKPDWSLLPIPGVENLPALQWKLMNIRKMNPTKHQQALTKLKVALHI